MYRSLRITTQRNAIRTLSAYAHDAIIYPIQLNEATTWVLFPQLRKEFLYDACSNHADLAMLQVIHVVQRTPKLNPRLIYPCIFRTLARYSHAATMVVGHRRAAPILNDWSGYIDTLYTRAQLGFSLNIPIFNGMKTKYRVKMTELSIADQQLDLENTEKTLCKEIRQAYGNAQAAQQKMAAMQNSLEASRVAYEYAKGGYDMGKKTLLELNESKIRFHKAESDLLQARYEYLYRCKIIEFYKNAK